jgi:CRP-like cAMP-binding protein
VLYAVFVAVLTAVVADMDTSARAYRSRIEMVNHYMQHSQLPRELRAKLRTYYQLCYPQRRAFDEDGILGEVSRPLKQEVCLHKCRSVLAALQLLDAGERGSGVEGLPGAISMELQRVVFVTGDYIIREGEETEGLFFVSSGLVELLNSADPNAPITTLGAGSMFGEMALLSQTGRATATVRVQTFCEGYHLSKTSFNKLIYVYPSFKEYLQSVARLRLQKNTKLSPERRKQRGSVLLQGLIDDLTQERSVRMQGRIDQGRHHHKGADRQVARLMNKLNVNSRASEAAGGLDDGQPTTKFNVRRATMQAATAIFGKMQGGASRMSSRMSSRVSMGNSSSAAWAEERESGPSAAAPGDAGFGSMEA